jgi:large-conductance mechanosensitive channel
MEVNRYHRFLRVSLLVSAFVLLFQSGLVSPVSKEMSDQTLIYMGSVGTGMFASVEPNEINTLTAQISEQQRKLDAREALLAEREIAARAYDTSTPTDYSTFILSIIVFILTVLIIFNYILDWTRVARLNKISSLASYEKSMG